MKPVILFEEVLGAKRAHFKRPLLVIAGIFGVFLVMDLIRKEENADVYSFFLLAAMAFCIIWGVIAGLALQITFQLREDGIYINTNQAISPNSFYPWSIIADLKVRDVSWLAEYGGVGYRVGPSGKGYIFPSEKGLQIVLTNGERIFVSTYRAQKLTDVVKRLQRQGDAVSR